MKISGLLSRKARPMPGVAGVARLDRRPDQLFRRLKPGDIVVFDRLDLDRHTAERIVGAQAGAVVNISSSISGRFPNTGPEILLAAGVPLVDNVGPEVLRSLRDGTRIRVHEGVIYQGARELARGSVQTTDSVADQLVEAKAGMAVQLEAFAANSIEFLRRERSLLIDGIGVPVLDVPMRDRQVLIVAPGDGHVEDLRALRHYIKEYQPLLIGVGAGAKALIDARRSADVIVTTELDRSTVRPGTVVVLPADEDGHTPGLEKAQDLGVTVVPFSSSLNLEDMALLLAEAGGARLVVTVGAPAGLREFLDRGLSGANPSTFLTRLKLGADVVDAKAVATLHRNRVSMAAVVLLVVAAVVVVLTALFVSNLGSVYSRLLVDGWQQVSGWAGGLF